MTRNNIESFFSDLATVNMNATEIAVYNLKLEREALLRASKNYHRDRLHIQRFIEPGPAQDQALQKLNETYPLGYARKELDVVNRAIAKAIVDLNNHQANNLKDGQHFNTRKSARNLGGISNCGARPSPLGTRHEAGAGGVASYPPLAPAPFGRRGDARGARDDRS
jgi:hypothetical protein